MSPLVWDLGHVAYYEELWLVRRLVDGEPAHPELDAAYDAFETPRATRGDIGAALADLPGPVEIVRAGPEASRASPGHMERHYQPDVPLALVESDLPLDEAGERARAALGVAEGAPAVLTLDDDPRICARTLYADLRRVAAGGAPLLLVRLGPERSGEAWEAIRDRLTRASGVVL